MLVAGPQPTPVDDEHPEVELDVRPREPEHLALPEAQRQSDDPTRCVPPAVGYLHEEPNLFDRVGHPFFLHQTRMPRISGMSACPSCRGDGVGHGRAAAAGTGGKIGIYLRE